MPRRTKYLWVACPSIMAVAAWLIWLSTIVQGDSIPDQYVLASILRGEVIRGLDIQPIGGDFSAYYIAGRLMKSGQSSVLYDAPMKDFGPYLRPPFYAWLFVPFSCLPYVLAAILWMALSLGCVWLSVKLLAPSRPSVFWWVLTFMPVQAVIRYGQGEALSLLLLCIVSRLWQQERLWCAGLVCSMLLHKFPLLLGVVLLWVFGWKRDWRALGGVMLGGAVLAGISLSLIPEASLAYVQSSGWILSLIHSKGFPLGSFVSVRGFWLMLLPGYHTWADALYIICVGVFSLGFYGFWHRHRADKEMIFAGAVSFTALVTPYAFIYDWVILVLPAIWLWRNQIHGWRNMFAVVWLATFWSRFLTIVQLSVLPFAIQMSVPALVFAAIKAYAELDRQKVAGGETRTSV